MRTDRDQRVWDGIYAATWAGLVLRQDSTSILATEELTEMAAACRGVADRGLEELKDCPACGGDGQTIHSEDLPIAGACDACGGTGRRP